MTHHAHAPSKTDLRRGHFPSGSAHETSAAEQALLLGDILPPRSTPRPESPQPLDQPGRDTISRPR